MAITVNFTGKAGIAGTEVDITGAVTDVGNSVPVAESDRIGILKSRVDVGLIPSSSTKTNADVYQAINVPKYFKVIDAWFEVIEAEATNTTACFALGITGGTTDGFVTAATCAVKDVSHASTNASTYSAAGGWSSSAAADTIDLLVSVAAFTNVVVDVYAVVVDMRATANR
jgi:hypothetical protein